VCSGCEVITRLPHVHFQKFSCVIVMRGETVVSANKLAVPVVASPPLFLYIYFVSVTEHGLSSGLLMKDAKFRLI
jgi:hypothetical protein